MEAFNDLEGDPAKPVVVVVLLALEEEATLGMCAANLKSLLQAM